mmetsp:Transcript_47517/g.54707  ORF Transcript_47517/g.54707 Transcript_47517/m.54707 type:complete len:93 (+) Transcript_47517:792-1070(+)
MYRIYCFAEQDEANGLGRRHEEAEEKNCAKKGFNRRTKGRYGYSYYLERIRDSCNHFSSILIADCTSDDWPRESSQEKAGPNKSYYVGSVAI